VNEQEYIQSGAIEACVLGVATEQEQRELEQWKAQSPVVARAVAAFEEQLEQQALSAAIAPPVSVKQAVWNETVNNTGYNNEGNQAPVVAMNATPRKSVWKQYAVAASVAIALSSVATNFILMGRMKQMNQEVAVLKKEASEPKVQYAFMENPEITPVAMYGVGSHTLCRCSLYWDKKTKKAYIMIHHLAGQPEEKDYQLWALVDGQPHSVGTFKPGPDKSQPIALPNVPEGATIFAVTLEKKGGVEKPTLEQMYLKGQISI
jgi:anti-sigma-K factor RskA